MMMMESNKNDTRLCVVLTQVNDASDAEWFTVIVTPSPLADCSAAQPDQVCVYEAGDTSVTSKIY